MQATDMSWYNHEVYPELRAGPPWVMEEMIDSEPYLAPGIAEQADVAGRIADAVLSALRAGKPVTVTGCGTSEHGAMAVAELVEDAARQQEAPSWLVYSRQALEATLDPWEGVCLAVSHDGGTRATILAMEGARSRGATICLITGRAESPAAAVADIVLVTPEIDRSWCHTVAYVSAILAGGLIAAAINGSQFDGVSTQRYLESVRRGANKAHEVAANLASVSRFVTTGSGSDRGSARELALKIEEGVRLPATERDLETLLHGHLVSGDSAAGIVLLATDPRGGSRRTIRARHVLMAGERLAMPATAILSPAVDADVPAALTPAGRLVLSDSGSVPRLLAALSGAAIMAQMLTLGLIHVHGTNPDLIRREEAPYREAAGVAENEAGW